MPPSLTPAVQNVVESVRRLVRDGTLRPGSPLPTENVLAARLGASRNTVRRAIVALVQAGVVERRPHARPIVLGGRLPERSPERREVHVWVCHTIGDHGTLAFLRGLSKALSRTPYRVSVREPSKRSAEAGFEEERRFLIEALHSPGTAAVVLTRDAYADNRDMLDGLVDAGIPMVFVDGGCPAGLQADFVGTANLLAAQRAVESLIDLGHRHIVCLTDDLVPPANTERTRGFRRALAQAATEIPACVLEAKDLSPEPIAARPAEGPYAERLDRRGYFGILASRLVGAVLAMDPRPTALFATCDALAYDVCAYLQGAGVEVPEQMSVVGFDGLARFGAAPSDGLTTCAQDFEGFGIHAASLVLDRLEGGDAPEPRRVLLDAPLAVRSSTTHPPAHAETKPLVSTP